MVPMAKSAIFGPKRAKSIFPKFSGISANFALFCGLLTLFGRRHEARGREIFKFSRGPLSLSEGLAGIICLLIDKREMPIWEFLVC